MRTRHAALLVAATLTAAAAAQETAGVERKNRVPVSAETLRVSFPKARQMTLPNGINVLVLQDREVPTVSMSLSLLAGSFFEPAGRSGLSDMTASMLEEGTKSRTSEQIAQLTDRLGASIGASGGQGGEYAAVSGSGMAEDTATLMALMADLARNPVFPQGPFDRLKRQTLAGLQRAMTQPGTLSDIATARSVYGNAPPAQVMASEADVQALTVDDLKSYHARYFRPEGAYLAVTGDVKPETVFDLARKHFGDWKATATPTKVDLPSFRAPSATRVVLVDRPGSVQANISALTLGITRKDSDYVPLVVMNRILGGLPSSRLEANIREAKGYAYYARSSLTAPEYPGTWQADTEARNAVAVDATKELLRQVDLMRTERVTDAELAAAKRNIVGGFAMRLESPEALLGMALDVKRFGLPDDYWDTYPAKVQAVTAADVQAMARKYLAADRLNVVVVGEASALAEGLKVVGPVTVVKDPKEVGGPA